MEEYTCVRFILSMGLCKYASLYSDANVPLVMGGDFISLRSGEYSPYGKKVTGMVRF